MAERKRIVASTSRKGGRAVTRGGGSKDGHVPGAVLSRARADELHAALRKIDEAQHGALADGDRYYLGAPS